MQLGFDSSNRSSGLQVSRGRSSTKVHLASAEDLDSWTELVESSGVGAMSATGGGTQLNKEQLKPPTVNSGKGRGAGTRRKRGASAANAVPAPKRASTERIVSWGKSLHQDEVLHECHVLTSTDGSLGSAKEISQLGPQGPHQCGGGVWTSMGVLRLSTPPDFSLLGRPQASGGERRGERGVSKDPPSSCVSLLPSTEACTRNSRAQSPHTGGRGGQQPEPVEHARPSRPPCGGWPAHRALESRESLDGQLMELTEPCRGG